MKLSLNYLFLASLFFLNSCSSNVSVPESKFIIDKENNLSYRGCTKEDLTGIWELHTQLCNFPREGGPTTSISSYKDNCKAKESVSDFYYPNQLLIFNQDNDGRAAFESSTGNKKSWDIKRALDDLKTSRMASKSGEQFVPKDQLAFKVNQEGVLSNVPGFPAACLCTFTKRPNLETITLQFFQKDRKLVDMKLFEKVKNF